MSRGQPGGPPGHGVVDRARAGAASATPRPRTAVAGVTRRARPPPVGHSAGTSGPRVGPVGAQQEREDGIAACDASDVLSMFGTLLADRRAITVVPLAAARRPCGVASGARCRSVRAAPTASCAVCRGSGCYRGHVRGSLLLISRGEALS